MNSDPRWWRVLYAAALAAFLVVSMPLAGRSLAQKKQAAEKQFVKAGQLREALNARPAKDRSRRDYQRALEAYRAVYYIAPTSAKAEPSVLAVAELLLEMGRAFHEEKTFRNAIEQYEFLRREYPGSPRRADALFTIAQIYHQDLDEDAEARTVYQELLKRYPRSRLVEEARDALADIEKDHAAKKTQREPDKGRASSDDATTPLPEPAESPASVRHGRIPLVTGIRHWSTPDYTRIAIDLDQQVKYEAGRVPNPDRIFFDLHDTRLAPELVGKSFDVEDGFLRKIRVAQYQRGLTRVVLEVDEVSEYSAFFLPNPYRLIVDIHGQQPGKAAAKNAEAAPETAKAPPKTSLATKAAAKAGDDDAPEDRTVVFKPSSMRTPKAAGTAEVAKLDPPEVKATSKPTTAPTFESVSPRAPAKKGKRSRTQPASGAHEAKPTSSGEQTLIRALGLKIGRIVVDAGHGGHDTGTIGPNGLTEKDLVLDVALRLGKLVETRMGSDVVYTRDDDTFIPLETRTAIANKVQADLFISIHANSSRDPSARGVETYYLNFTSSPDALEVAARENAVSEKSIHELQDLVKKIALKEKIEESREFAYDVQQSMQASPTARSTRDRGIKKAPFIVLIGANMPSILAEISFLSNPADERRLSTPEYRQKIAEALYHGIAKYVSGLSGVKMATRIAKDSGQ